MKTFYTLSASIALVTLGLLCLNTVVDVPTTPNYKEEFRGLAYRHAKVDGWADCTLLCDLNAGVEFRAEMWGVRQVQVAYDNSIYWFWVRSYDQRCYYICPASEVQNTSLIPPLRPSFSRWMLNREKESSSFIDGEYEVDIVLEGGSVASQRYSRNGVIEVEVKVIAFQESNGMEFPALATLYIASNKALLTIDLGRVEVNPSEGPETSEPEGLKRRDLAP